jgi:F420-dependent oxidoreductase-like protein
VRLGLSIGYVERGSSPADRVALAQEAERLGFDSVWAAEAWGSDAVTPLAWIGASTSRIKIGSAVLQMPARTPANTAMTAATLDLLSGGRFLLGLGTSGPQVVEGWHGQPWAKPLSRTREYVDLVRRMLRRETIEHHGEHYDIPYRGAGASGLGIPLKLMLRPVRSELPIYLAALGPKNVALAAEIADGWIPFLLSPDRFDEIFRPSLAAATGRKFEIAALVPAAVGDDVAACRDSIRPLLALYVGGMGAPGQNFYNALVGRYGYEAEGARIQELYLAGKHREAAGAVPDELVDEVALVGPVPRIRDRLDAWRACGVTTLILRARNPAELRALADI